jgi:excinuclease UvrABC ATPase subunit
VHDGDVIRIVGAREHNLQGIDLEIPKRALTVVTGVSGSGKSSLVFSTIAAEAQRLINETYPAFVQGFMPALARPDVDRLEGLTPAIVVDQERMGGNPRSTVGTATDANALLRILFSRLGEPSAGPAMAYSFNVASVSARGAITVDRAGAKTQRVTFDRRGGMCPRCEGLGSIHDFDVGALLDESRSLADGAITVPGYTPGGWNGRIYAESGLVDPTKPIRDLSDAERRALLLHEPVRMKIAGINMTYEGLIPRLRA